MICPLPRANEFDVAYHTFKSNKFETIHIIAFYNFMYLSRVRTGYGILEKLWNFEKEIPYMEKLWNLNKTAVLMEKLWNFRFGGKNECLLKKKKRRENTSRLRNVVSMFVASVITSLGLALQTSRAIALAYSWNE